MIAQLFVGERARHMTGFIPRGARQLALIASALALAFGTASLHYRASSTDVILSLILPDADTSNNPMGAQGKIHEPYANRWQRRFSSESGYLYFSHIRKAAGTAVRNYLFEVMKYHGHATFDQFLNATGKEEAMRHLPFLSREQKQIAQSYYANQTNTSPSQPHKSKVYFIEQELAAIDWRCRDIDRRWNASLSVIVLRHPIERHLSEFFYSGPPATGKFDGQRFKTSFGINNRGQTLQINRTKLHTNETYKQSLSKFLEEGLRTWAHTDSAGHRLKFFLGQTYNDNFQLRALAGCASGDCLERKEMSDEDMAAIDASLPTAPNTTPTTDSVCTMHPFYHKAFGGKNFRQCNKIPAVCPRSCDGPCFYASAAWGPLDERDLSRAIYALEGFDVVLLAETIDDGDQQAFLADVLGVPRSINRTNVETNILVEKMSSREKTHYYRDLMSNLTSPHLMNSLVEENRLEIEFYQHAVRLNKIMTERWKREVNWKV